MLPIKFSIWTFGNSHQYGTTVRRQLDRFGTDRDSWPIKSEFRNLQSNLLSRFQGSAPGRARRVSARFAAVISLYWDKKCLATWMYSWKNRGIPGSAKSPEFSKSQPGARPDPRICCRTSPASIPVRFCSFSVPIKILCPVFSFWSHVNANDPDFEHGHGIVNNKNHFYHRSRLRLKKI